MNSQVEKIVKTYRSLVRIPAVTGAKILSNGALVSSVWTERNLETGKNAKFQVGYQFDANLKLLARIPPVDISSEFLVSTSPSEKFKAVLRELENKDGRKQYLEIWSHENMIRCVDLKALELHGDIYTDGDFASFEWSTDEKKLLYVAEKKFKKSEPFYKRQPPPKANGDDQPIVGEEYLFRQDWGEQLVGKKFSVLAEYNVEEDSINIIEGTPEDICVAQPVWSPDGSYIVGVALKTEPRKLGLVYCANRVSTIFCLDIINGKYTEMCLEDACVKSPRFSPDGNTLIWLQREAGGPHMSSMALCKVSVPFTYSVIPEIVIPQVETEIPLKGGSSFTGLYITNLATRCWAKDGRLLLSTPQKYQVKTYIVNLNTTGITELPFPEGSQFIIDIKDDLLLVNRRNFLYQDRIAIGKLPPDGQEASIEFKEFTGLNKVPNLDHCTFHYMDLEQHTNDAVTEFSAIYIGPKTGSEREVPLIVWPHGGPHSVFVNNLSLEESLFISMGFAVLLVNYRGSLGAGTKSVKSLLGRIGCSDVRDCILATETALMKYPWLDPNRMALVGGSHGGFLVTHISGQYPEMFKAVVARNPVIDVASMSIISDIPDWCYVEVGGEYTQVGEPNLEMLLNMRRCSPIQHAHKVKAPTLLLIGCKDLRVPPSQSLEYYYRLKAQGVKVKLNAYEDNHPLGTVPNEMDNLINTVRWIQENISEK